MPEKENQHSEGVLDISCSRDFSRGSVLYQQHAAACMSKTMNTPLQRETIFCLMRLLMMVYLVTQYCGGRYHVRHAKKDRKRAIAGEKGADVV